jgi:hypothetical protein
METRKKMDEFSYLSVLVSIILGLSVTQILQGFAGLIQTRQRVQMFWPAAGWAALLLVIDIQSWWAMFGMRDFHAWNFLIFLVVLLQVIFLYLLAALVLPSFDGEHPFDLRDNYFHHARWFFSFLVALIATSILKEVLLSGALPEPLNLGFQLFFALLSVMAIYVRSLAYHKIAFVVAAFCIGVYIALLFAHLH